MGITLRDASEKVGVTRQTLMKAIKTGRVSAEKSENGEWRIEPVELFRVWPPVNEVQQPLQADLTGSNTPSLQVETGQVVELLKAEVDDLRRRLDQAESERREAQARVMGLLSDQRPRGFWSRLFDRQEDSPTNLG